MNNEKFNAYLFSVHDPDNVTKIPDLTREEAMEVANTWWNNAPVNECAVVPVDESQDVIDFANATVCEMSLDVFRSISFRKDAP